MDTLYVPFSCELCVDQTFASRELLAEHLLSSSHVLAVEQLATPVIVPPTPIPPLQIVASTVTTLTYSTNTFPPPPRVSDTEALSESSLLPTESLKLEPGAGARGSDDVIRSQPLRVASLEFDDAAEALRSRIRNGALRDERAEAKRLNALASISDMIIPTPVRSHKRGRPLGSGKKKTSQSTSVGDDNIRDDTGGSGGGTVIGSSGGRPLSALTPSSTKSSTMPTKGRPPLLSTLLTAPRSSTSPTPSPKILECAEVGCDYATKYQVAYNAHVIDCAKRVNKEFKAPGAPPPLSSSSSSSLMLTADSASVSAATLARIQELQRREEKAKQLQEEEEERERIEASKQHIANEEVLKMIQAESAIATTSTSSIPSLPNTPALLARLAEFRRLLADGRLSLVEYDTCVAKAQTGKFI